MPKVIVYSTSWCPWCARVKEFLDKNGVKYEHYDVGENPEKAQEMFKKSGQMGVPVVDVDGRIVVGFNEERLKQLLGIK